MKDQSFSKIKNERSALRLHRIINQNTFKVIETYLFYILVANYHCIHQKTDQIIDKKENIIKVLFQLHSSDLLTVKIHGYFNGSERKKISSLVVHPPHWEYQGA
jgi:hypothetical protein